MTLHDSALHNGSQAVDVIPDAPRNEHQGAPDASTVSGDVPTAEQHTPARSELENENDPLTDYFMFLLPVALFVLFAIFAALTAWS